MAKKDNQIIMKVVFIQNFSGFHFGVMYLSSILKQNGCETEVFIGGEHKNIIEEICKAKPDLVGFTCITGEHRWVEKTAKLIKEKINVPIIVGGPHPTYFPEMINMEGIDMICRGDGEIVLLELVKKIQNGEKPKGIIGPVPLIQNLDELPWPDWDIYQKYSFFREETEFPVCLSRGCPFNCSFCYNAAKKKLYAGEKTVRLRSADNIIQEMKVLKEKYGQIKMFVFNDDNLGIDLVWFRGFCKKYGDEIGLPFFASIRADFVTEETAASLKYAHCHVVSIGVETGNEMLRQKILQKNIPNEQYIKAARLIRKNGIKLRTSNILFLPGETLAMAFETLALNKKMKTDAPWIFTLQPYPGTEIYRYAVDNGFLGKDFSFDEIDPLGMIESPMRKNLKDGRQIKILQNLFYYGVKVPGFDYLLKFLVRLPNNFIFEGMHRLGILLSYASYHKMGLKQAFLSAWRAISVEGRKN